MAFLHGLFGLRVAHVLAQSTSTESRAFAAMAAILLALPAAGQGAEAEPSSEARKAPGNQSPPRTSGGVLQPDQACYDVRHYQLRIEVLPSTQSIEGTLTMTADALADIDAFALDLDNLLTVRSVRINGVASQFQHRNRRVAIEARQTIAKGSSFAVAVTYGGRPLVAKNPPWTGGFTWSQTSTGEPWIATTCQGEGGDIWWPCKDHPSDKPDSFDLLCIVPSGLVVASNGTLQGEPEAIGDPSNGGQTLFHWRSNSPISNYNIALNIAPYVELKHTYTSIDGTEMPIQFFVLPASKKRAERCMPQFLDHIAVFEKLLGPYPFRHEKYGIAETPHLGMEHQTIIAYGNGFRDEQWDWLHNHELAHEWWGNLVTCRDWKDMWLHEGFGTYMQPLYREVRFGKRAYRQSMWEHKTFNRRPLAPRASQDSRQIYFAGGGGNDLYYKGSQVLHTLRYLLGDETFLTVLRRFCYPNKERETATDGSQVRFVDTDDFVALVGEVAKRDLGWFFEVYVRSAGLPLLHYEVKEQQLLLRWQTPGDLPFPMRVPVRIGNNVLDVEMPNGKGEIGIGELEFAIDPDRKLLMGPTKEKKS
ncbi:MAG: M1 family metallopeptidase [Planctomycetota bacterium]